MTEVWSQWEGQVINGVLPLHRFLGASDHSAVFLTDYRAQNLAHAALKLVPAVPASAQAQLAQWTTTATLAHPHLIRLFEAGRCRLGGLEFIFVVMEYAEQTLSQIVQRRPLAPDEVRDMLPPTLSALAFLHGKNLVHGQLKPSNILAVNDQLKLASDGVRPAGNSAANIAGSSVYGPPEATDRIVSLAGDIWCLGVTLVEALTQHAPSCPDGESATVAFPDALPPPFMAIVRQCLNRNPANRPTIDQVEAQIRPAPQLPVDSGPDPSRSTSRPLVSNPKPRIREVPARAASSGISPKRRVLLPMIAMLSLVVVVVWLGVQLLGAPHSLPRAAAPPAAPSPSEMPHSAPPGVPSDQHALAPANRLPSVLHEEIPDVPRHIRDTIRGHIKGAVRVTLDGAGNVVGQTLAAPGPSKYFARLATEAAGKWKFAPAGNRDPRTWLLQFEFTRGGVTGHLVIPKS